LSYFVALVARNAAPHLSSTLESLLHQTLTPSQLIVVDDGSTDNTSQILTNYQRQLKEVIRVVSLPDKGYDIRRVPANINLAWRTVKSLGLSADYLMISGDDCTYPPSYAQFLVSRMSQDQRIVVASGRPSFTGNFSQEHSPSGSGRFIRSSFWREVGEAYPVRAGWETWLLYRALANGFDVKLFDDQVFEHVRPRGAKHQFAYWGAAMQGLGYHPLYALGRIAKNMFGRNVAFKGSLNMVRGYLVATLGSSDSFISTYEPALRRFVRADQGYRVVEVVGKLFQNLRF
jgi:glycosyltransferase involved in cell wall biosynthesis